MYTKNNGYLTGLILLEMQKYDLSPSSTVSFDEYGELYRYNVCGDTSGTKNGWCVAFNNDNGIGCAIFGSWKTGAKHIWCSVDRSEISAELSSEISRKINEAKRLSSIRKAEEQKLAAERALNLWNSFGVADPFHPYLIKKRVPPFAARQTGNELVLPIVDCDNKLRSLQYIDPNGRKLLFAGGAKRGNFIPVHGCLSCEDVIISEGWATAATLAKQYPNRCVISAIDAGNLEPVALAIRTFKPYSVITIAGDDDRLTEGNPGATKARSAASSAGAQLILPPWPFDAPRTLTDFNDLACWLEDNSKEMEQYE